MNNSGHEELLYNLVLVMFSTDFQIFVIIAFLTWHV